ncbi:MAG: hypothetical protein LBF75_04770 [Treponema sp.]|nr:hypothetical protein [Treponema sp.]
MTEETAALGTKQEALEAEKPETLVNVVFKNTYVGTLGIFYKKNQYRIPQKIADLLKDDIEKITISEA